MASLLHLFNKTIVVARITVANADTDIFATVTSAAAQIQPTDRSKDEIGDGLFGKTFNIYMEGSVDVQEGDLLRDTNTSEEYQVMTGGMSRRTFGSIDFIVCLCEKTT